MKKIVFSDLDKTLRTPGKPMDERVKQLIREIIAIGVGFVYCTGKPCSYVTGAATEWEIPDAWILGSTGSVLYKGTTMPPQKGYAIYPFNKWELAQFHIFIKRLRDKLKKVDGIFWQPNGEAESFCQTVFWGNDMELKNKIMTIFYDLWKKMPNNQIKYFDNIDAIDIMVSSVDKAKGMMWVAQMEGVSTKNCYACGDSDNDLSMLCEAKKYGHDYVVGKHNFRDGYEPTHRFDTYEEMLRALFNDLLNDT